MSAITTTPVLQNYLAAFEAFDKRPAPAWLNSMRHEAFSRFFELGFPTTKDEDWRFTNVSAIANTRFELARPAQLSAEQIAPFALGRTACHLVFVNGRYAPELSSPATSGEIGAISLAEAIAAEHPLVERHLGRYADFRSDAFLALNTAFLEDGALVHIRRGVVLDAPIYILYVSTGDAAPQMVSPRNLIIADENCQAQIVEDYISVNAGVFFSNVLTELVAAEGAVLEHYMIEREDRNAFNISTLRTQQGRSANVASHSVLLGGALVRNNVHPVLAGEGGECLINGLFVGAARQHLDNYMKVEHASPHCASRQFYNGILDDHARGVFHGRIIVHKDAQKTDAKQTNRNLLLSDDAQIDTKPQLEIYADDVKCTHGATIGQIDDEALFYMRSRGLDEPEARGLLLFAFARECLDRMKPGPVRAMLERVIPGWLPKAITRPETASIAERKWEEVG